MPTVIQAVLNEHMPKDRYPAVPVTASEVGADIDAVVAAGASQVHFHARRPDGSQAPDDEGYYREAIAASAIGAAVPWFPPQGFGSSGASRWRHVPGLVKNAGLELITIDPQLFDVMIVDEQSGEIQEPWFLDVVASEDGTEEPESELRQWLWFCKEAQRLGIKPIFGILEPGALRKVITWVRLGIVDPPLALHLTLTEHYHFGLPAEPESFEVLKRMIPSDIPYEWFYSPSGVSKETEDRLRRYAIEHGGHLRIGLGCTALGDLPSTVSNAEIVAAVADQIGELGGVVATIDQARSILGQSGA